MQTVKQCVDKYVQTDPLRPTVQYGKCTVGQLEALCRENRILAPARARKQDLMDALAEYDMQRVCTQHR